MYKDAAHVSKAKITIPYSNEIMNHDYIGSLGCIPNEPKSSSIFFPFLTFQTLMDLSHPVETVRLNGQLAVIVQLSVFLFNKS